jgi:uncharacterized paraquat-inducible protein A
VSAASMPGGRSLSPVARECLDCGQFQMVPALGAGATARCVLCGAVLRRAQHDPLGRSLALHLAALAMLGVAGLMSLMTVSTGGVDLSADLCRSACNPDPQRGVIGVQN